MNLKRILSVIIALAMVIGTMGFTAFAAEHTASTADELTSAIANAQAGDIIKLTADITLSNTLNIEKSITLDGDGHKLIPADTNATYNSAIMAGNSGWGDENNATSIKLADLDISNWKVSYGVVRVQGVTFEMDGCTLSNNSVSNYAYSVVSLNFANSVVKNSVFENNTCPHVIDANYNGDDSTARITIDNCRFVSNPCSGAAVVYRADGSKITVSDSEFVDNTVSTNGNAAILYTGWGTNDEISGCLFTGNTVTTSHTTTKRFASAIFCDGCTVNSNVFNNNSATRNGEAISTTVAVGAYYGAADVSDNYFDGKEPVLGVDYTVEFTNNEVTLDSYYTDYTTDENGNVIVDESKKVELAPEIPAPDMTGTIINVTAANAQLTLDGAYGDITGKTINFTESISDTLDLARPTKYQGSNTVYYNYVNYTLETTPTPWSEDISSVMNSHSRYYRTLENVTFTADEGVSVGGFHFCSNHYSSSGYDYVREVEQTSGVAHYEYRSAKNLTFDGLTITGSTLFDVYLENVAVENIVFDGCTFIGDANKKTNSMYCAVKTRADNYHFKNFAVINCSITDFYQGVTIQGIDGLTVTNNTIKNTVHNAIAIQSSTSNYTKGSVIVEENYIEGITDRAIRINNVDDAVIEINNNIMVNSGDDEGQLIKAGSTGTGKIDLEYNYWDGKDVSTAVDSSLAAPATTGISGGTFDVDITDYVAEGVNVIVNADGTYSAQTPVAATIGSNSYASLEEALNAANAGDTIYLKAGNHDLVYKSYSEGRYWLPKNITIIGEDGAVVTNSPKFSAESITIDNVDFIYEYGSACTFYTSGNSKFANLTFKGPNGTYYSTASGTLTVENCKVITEVYGLHVAEGNATVNVVKTEISGWNTYGSGILAIFDGCTFVDDAPYADVGFYNNATFENCVFDPGMSVFTQTSDVIDIAFESCRVSDGSSLENIIDAEAIATVNVTIDGKKLEPPVVISTADDLRAFADAVNAGNTYQGKTVKLAGDIDLNYSAVVIGTKANPFMGTFDGCGYTVKNLSIRENGSDGDYFADTDDYVGLFGVINSPAVVKNVTVDTPNIVGQAYVGAIVGCAYTGTVENCHVTGEIDIKGNYMVGGITGQGWATIKDCSVIGAEGWDYNYIGATYLKADREGDNVGGIVGQKAEPLPRVISGCRVENVTVEGTRKVGGVIGQTFMGNDVVNCSAKNVTVKTNATADYAAANATSMSVGGIVGHYRSSGDDTGMLAENTAENITLVDTNNVGAAMGYITGGLKGTSSPVDVVDTMTVAANNVTGTNTGATSEFANNTDGAYVDTWNTGTDSGAYGDGNVAMMRFLFALGITDAIDVEKSGIKYIAANDISADVKGTSDTGASKAFYGDVTGIPAEEAGNSYYAVAYITTETGKTYWSDPLGCTVNFDKFFSAYTGGNN